MSTMATICHKIRAGADGVDRGGHIMKSNKREKSRGAPSDSGSTEISWADLSGERLAVDLAHQAVKKPAGRKRARKRAVDDDDIDEFDAELWKSEHYDGEDETTNERQVDQDLFDPNPEHKSNKFDPGNTVDGAHDAGMFYSLEVIPGDAYRVERTGDDNTGFINRVVFTDQSRQKPSEKEGRDSVEDGHRHPSGKGGPKSTEPGKPDDPFHGLSRRERVRLKRKLKKEQVKERKRLKREGLQSSKNSDAKTDCSKDDEAAVARLQTTWSISAPGVTLHETLSRGLHSLEYSYPTPIQASTLPAAILGRRDIVGAAPTGSGKTLSYGLPILQYLLDERDASASRSFGVATPESTRERLPLQALILTPTRELALQVTSELQKVSCNSVKIGTIVGGFAEVKQQRTLNKVRPPVLVATPGRLWELMSSKDYEHLNDLTQLRFLCVDEADRMIKQGSFPQLRQIFELIDAANPAPQDEESDDEDSSDDDDDDDDDRLRGLRGVRGEAKVVMLSDDIMAGIERERCSLDAPSAMVDDDEYDEAQQEEVDDEDGDSDEQEEAVHRQTFIYSATLTLPPSMHHLIKKDVSKKKPRRKGRQPTTVDGAIAEILEVSGARGETKVVDLSRANAKKDIKSEKNGPRTSSESLSVPTTRLPEGLTLGQIECAQRHKDSHVYAYLVTTRQGSSGPCLVFCNSIAAVRRVGETLKTLGLPVKMLHAQMQQKSRLSALESLKSSNSRSVVVASDVAARGLDIAQISTVIHYDVARTVDTFIHRAGRTARGVGNKAVGTSISLVSPAEEREHQKICESIRGSKSLEKVSIDGRLLHEAQERTALATKIVACNDIETQASRKNKWLLDAAKSAELEVDEDLLEESLLDGDQRDRQRFLEAKRAKARLRALLAKPMKVQHWGKFLCMPGVKETIKAQETVNPLIIKRRRIKRR